MEKINLEEIESTYSDNWVKIAVMLRNVVDTVNECVDKINELDNSLLNITKVSDINIKEITNAVSSEICKAHRTYTHE